MNVITMGVHVLDILVRPVESIPEGQGSVLVENIEMAPAGTAGGTAVTLAKLGATVRTAGAVGTDPTGDMLVTLLRKAGVDTGFLVRRDGVPTSASVLPIRPNGDRPAFHLLGANPTYGQDDVPWDALREADHLHLGGPELLGPDNATRILKFAREHGVSTSVDLLAPGALGSFELIAPFLPHVDYFLPNEDQVLGFTGESDLDTGCRRLVDGGVGVVAVTRGGDGARVVDAQGTVAVPAVDVTVVDTTGCGDAFSAGFVVGVKQGRDPRDAAVLGCAVAGLVAQGLGSAYGDFDLAAAEALIA
ncbi:carbohydrate kinase family protein [Actinophytocola sp.]|uniref:carbohydrate kinase family protein n=1 Tax=Actinophytocola sp. TaxID=1872138 RepID=UPI002ED08EFA